MPRKSLIRRLWVRWRLPSNCWLFHRWLIVVRADAGREWYSVKRKTRWRHRLGVHRAVPHYLYAERRPSGTWRVVSYVPPRDGSFDVVLLFFGRVKWGDR